MTTQIQNNPVYQLPFLYINGLLISNDATTPNTILDISAGQCRDSNDVIDITLGSPNIEGSTISAPLKLNAAVNGANGLDTGSLAANAMYSIYMIADSRYLQPTACLATAGTNTTPIIPFGYDSSRLIGYWATDSSSHWQLGWMAAMNNNAQRKFFYEIPPQFGPLSGQTNFTAVNMSGRVPAIDNLSFDLQVTFTGNSAGNTLILQTTNSGTNTQQFSRCQVSSIGIITTFPFLSQLSAGAPTFNWKSFSGSDSVTYNIMSYDIPL